MNGQKGFTLIELLVVIAIIAILMAILIPTLSNVREQANRSACSNNIRQHLLGLIMYADENDNKFPSAAGYWLWDMDRDIVWQLMMNIGLKPTRRDEDTRSSTVYSGFRARMALGNTIGTLVPFCTRWSKVTL